MKAKALNFRFQSPTVVEKNVVPVSKLDTGTKAKTGTQVNS